MQGLGISSESSSHVSRTLLIHNPLDSSLPDNLAKNVNQDPHAGKESRQASPHTTLIGIAHTRVHAGKTIVHSNRDDSSRGAHQDKSGTLANWI